MNEIAAVGSESLQPTHPATETPTGPERPWLYGLLIAPSAIVANGVIQGGVLAYLLSTQGVGSGQQSHLIFLLALPTSLYFLWSPITDFFVRRRTWLATGGILAAILMALAFHQKNLSSRTAFLLMLLSACCSQLVVSSCGGMMGAMRSDANRRTAGSLYQAGSMGFGALSAWGLVWLSSRYSHDVLGLFCAATIGLPALFVIFAPPQQQVSTGSFDDTMRLVWQECKSTFGHWSALPYIGCMVFPMASGAAVGLLPGVAHLYHVSGDSVAWMNGLGGGILMAAGAAVMSLIHIRARAAVLYMIVALINAVPLLLLWLGPLNPANYFTGVTLYLFTIGACYAMFTAVLLEFLGSSGKSGSGRYSIINSLGNVPVLYMLIVDGWCAEHFGPRALAGGEGLIGTLGALTLLALLLTIGKAPKSVPAPTPVTPTLSS